MSPFPVVTTHRSPDRSSRRIEWQNPIAHRGRFSGFATKSNTSCGGAARVTVRVSVRETVACWAVPAMVSSTVRVRFDYAALHLDRHDRRAIVTAGGEATGASPVPFAALPAGAQRHGAHHAVQRAAQSAQSRVSCMNTLLSVVVP